MINKIKGFKRFTTANLPTTNKEHRELGKVLGYNEAIDDIVKLFSIPSVIKSFKIDERLTELKEEKETLMNTRPSSDVHAQHLSDQIRVKNNLIWEIENILNVL